MARPRWCAASPAPSSTWRSTCAPARRREGQWHGEELTAENGRALYIPDGFAHGFQSLTDGSLLYYLMSHVHVPGAAAGIRFDDPHLAIAWPLAGPIVSDSDRALPGMDARDGAGA